MIWLKMAVGWITVTLTSVILVAMGAFTIGLCWKLAELAYKIGYELCTTFM